MKKLVTILLISSLAATISGCQEKQQQEGASLTTPEARIVGAQNIRLKKQLALKDQEIQAQKDLLAKCEDENAKLEASANKAGSGFIEMFSGSAKQIEILTKENQALKARIKELEK